MSNKSKKNLIVFLITSIIILLVVLCTLAFLIQTTKESTNPVIEQKTSTPKQNYEYMLKDINGKINVFKKGTEAPVDILEKGTNLKFGARPLRRAIQRYVEDEISEKILRGEIKNGQTITINFIADKLDIVGE